MFVGSFCSAVAPCCTSIGQPEQAGQAGCANALLSAGFSGDSELTTACLAEMQQLQNSPACLFDGADLTDPCSRAFNEPSGPHGPGEGCSVNADCAGSPGTVTSCVAVSGPGVCLSRRAGKLGDYPCLSTLTTSGVFLSEGLSGSPSAVGFFCDERNGLACDWSSRKCAALLPTGSACRRSSRPPLRLFALLERRLSGCGRGRPSLRQHPLRRKWILRHHLHLCRAAARRGQLHIGRSVQRQLPRPVRYLRRRDLLPDLLERTPDVGVGPLRMSEAATSSFRSQRRATR